jgi:hypothetical protein
MSKTRGLLGGLLVAVAMVAAAFGSGVLDRGATDVEASHTPGDVISIRHSGGDPGPFGGGSLKIAFVGVPFNAELWADASSAAYQGYQWEIAYDPVYLVHTGVNTELQSGTYSLCAGAAAVPFGPFIIYGQGAGCLSPGAPVNFIGQLTNIELMCVAPTSVAPFATAVALVAADPAEDALTDPVFGTSYIDPGGVLRPTSTAFKGPNPAGGTIAQIVVVCLNPADVSISKTDTNDPTAAPGSYTFDLVINDDLGNGPHTVDVSDTVPASIGTVSAVTDGPACSFAGNVVTCTGLSIPMGGSETVTITVDAVATQACNQDTNTASVTLTTAGFADVDPSDNSDNETHTIACTNVSIVKGVGPVGGPYAGAAVITAGDSVEYQYCVSNGAGASDATDVAVTDAGTPPAGQGAVGSTGPIPGGGGPVCLTAGPVLFASAGTFCNTATADPVNGGLSANSNEVCVTVNPSNPTKGIIDPADANPLGNIWLCKPLGAQVPGNITCGQGSITELIDLPDDVDTCNDDDDGDGAGCNADPGCTVSTSSDWDGDAGDLDCDGGEVGEGLGAFELQIKFDHKLFQHPDIDCQDPDSVLDDTGRVIQTTVDVITENWILVGCVTKDPTPGDGDNPEGPSVDGGTNVLVNIDWNVQPDLLERLRPTKDNGVRADLLDENCEAADILGSPYNMEVEANGSNNAPNGGLTDNCTDVTFTIRMLEGDIDLDCDVDVVDDQMIAFRYGATFGVLTYDPFFDLEPNTTPTDFDIDIKDLQFVFGRNGSTCLSPIPDQDPQPPIPDP